MREDQSIEQALIQRIREGDDAAFRPLLERYRAAALARIRRKLPVALRRKVDPDDVLQEAYIVAAQRIGDFEGAHEGSFGRWLAQIVEFKIRETLRHHLDTGKRDNRREQTHGARPSTRQFAGQRTSPSQAMIAEELESRAREALATLPEDYRQVLILVQQRGQSLREAAACLGRSYEATKKLYGRAVSRFRALLEEAADDGA